MQQGKSDNAHHSGAVGQATFNLITQLIMHRGAARNILLVLPDTILYSRALIKDKNADTKKEALPIQMNCSIS